MDSQEKFECWGVVEVMGHSRYAGKISELAIGGCNFVRVDVPGSEGCQPFTKLLSQGSIFAITPTTEQIARGMAQQCRQEPISIYDLPPMQRQQSLEAFDDDTEIPY